MDLPKNSAPFPSMIVVFLIIGIMDDKKKICGNCLLCLHTYLGCECSLTDNPVDYKQEACIDYISNED